MKELEELKKILFLSKDSCFDQNRIDWMKSSAKVLADRFEELEAENRKLKEELNTSNLKLLSVKQILFEDAARLSSLLHEHMFPEEYEDGYLIEDEDDL